MKGIYQEIIQEIQSLIASKNEKQARSRILEELSMPYIPQEVEAKLNELLDEVGIPESGKVQLSDEQLEEWLLGNDAKRQIAAVTQLQNANLRNYTALIQQMFDTHHDLTLESLLISMMIEQQINESFHLEREGFDIEFVPAVLEYPLESDGVHKAIDLLRDWYENDNPSFLNLCLDILAKECYLMLPMTLDEEDSLDLCLAIIHYVYRANGAEDEFYCFIAEKELAQTYSYELLLNKHDI